MSKVKSLYAREILDSRGCPTIEVVCTLVGGFVGRASVPSGKSTGVHEACELRDGDVNRYGGLGVLKPVHHINTEIFEYVHNKDFDQNTLDRALILLDGTENKSRLGANTLLGVSLAFARACAEEMIVPLYEYLGGLINNKDFRMPQPMFNIINGGKHSDSGLFIQEFMIAPTGFETFRRKVQAGSEVIYSLKKRLIKNGYSISVGDEGGFAPKIASVIEVFEHLKGAIVDAGYSFDQIQIGIDVAASSFYRDGIYTIVSGSDSVQRTNDDMVLMYKEMIQNNPIISIEDGFAEDDWEGFAHLKESIGQTVTIVGDDLTVTNTKRIDEADRKNAINSVLIKLNQIGTLSETLDAIKLTKSKGWIPFISHRSGETADTFIADLSVGTSCTYIKSGSLVRGERVVKYNRLLEIEELL